MMFTHDEMLSAVRAAGESGRPFTCGAVRDCLGVKSGDREKMNQFHRRFRSFQKAAADEIEKVGKNAYRLKHPERTRSEAPVAVYLAGADAPAVANHPEADAILVAPEELMEVDAEVAAAPPLSAADTSPPPATESRATEESAPAPHPAIAPPPAPSAPLESMEVPLRMIEIDFAVHELPPSTPAAAPARETPQPVIRAWLDRGQRIGRRVAELFGRA